MKLLPRRGVYKPQIVETARARLPQRNPPSRHLDTGPNFKLTKGFSPVILTSGEVSLSRGAIAVPDHGLLQPVERTAMLIDEIHFSGRTLAGDGISYFDPRWSIRAQLSLGRLAVTNGFIPVAGLEYAHLTNSLNCVFARTAGGGGGSDYAAYIFSSARWKLPVPLYVPAGSTLQCQLQATSSGFAWASGLYTPTLVADVTYVGRLLPVDYPVPNTIKVPYATALVSPDVASGNTPLFIESKDLQLGNPFDVPLFAQRFIMRNFNLYTVVVSMLTETYEGGAPKVTLRGTFNNVDVQIANNVNHYAVFDDGQPLGTFGTYGHRTLNLFNLEMAPKDRFDLLIDWRNVTLTPATPLQSAVATLIGWRNEVI